MTVNGDVSERPSPAKVRGVFLCETGPEVTSFLLLRKTISELRGAAVGESYPQAV